jgi:hypothetical protein
LARLTANKVNMPKLIDEKIFYVKTNYAKNNNAFKRKLGIQCDKDCA